MSFIAKNPLVASVTLSPPSTPPLGTRGLFPMFDGWYDVDADGVVKKLGSDSGGDSIAYWQPNTNYAVRQIVYVSSDISGQENDSLYQCLIEHTSGEYFTEGDYWSSLSHVKATYASQAVRDGNGNVIDATYATKDVLLQSIQYWQPNTDYNVGQTVLVFDGVENHLIVKCSTQHTSGSTFDLECWVVDCPIYATYASTANADSDGNVFQEHYITREVHIGDITNIEIVLDDHQQKINALTTALNYPIEGTEQSLLLVDKELSVFNETLTSLTISLPEDISDYVLFDCSFVFTSGETATTLSYSADSILWAGDDCDADGVFVPEANKTYEVYVKKLGNIISARVGVIVG